MKEMKERKHDNFKCYGPKEAPLSHIRWINR